MCVSVLGGPNHQPHRASLAWSSRGRAASSGLTCPLQGCLLRTLTRPPAPKHLEYFLWFWTFIPFLPQILSLKPSGATTHTGGPGSGQRTWKGLDGSRVQGTWVGGVARKTGVSIPCSATVWVNKGQLQRGGPPPPSDGGRPNNCELSRALSGRGSHCQNESWDGFWEPEGQACALCFPPHPAKFIDNDR